MSTPLKILLYGYGNPGRQDDGLGFQLVSRLEQWVSDNELSGYDFDNNYQLNIEDAEAISNYDLVIFVDASVEEIDDFCISKVDGTRDVTFTTHAASPGYIVQLCQELFGSIPPVYLVHIKGYEWEFKEGLSKKAIQNLETAFEACTEYLMQPEKLLDPDYTNLHFCKQ